MESVILQSPPLLAFILTSIGLCLWDQKTRSGFILQILSALSGGIGILCAFFSGASLTELTTVVLLMLVLQMKVFVRGNEE